MASYRQGILGAFSGKLGNVIGTFWKGISVMRVIPANVANPNTLSQQAQRAKFKLLVQFLAANSKFFKIGFSAVDNKMTEMNAALKANYENGVAGIFPDLSINTKNLIVSKGALPSLDGFAAVSTTPGTIDLSWIDNSSDVGAAGTDKINVAAFDEVTGESYYLLHMADRIDEGVTLNLPTGWSGRKVSVYAYAVTLDSIFGVSTQSQVSNSVKVDSLTIG